MSDRQISGNLKSVLLSRKFLYVLMAYRKKMSICWSPMIFRWFSPVQRPYLQGLSYSCWEFLLLFVAPLLPLAFCLLLLLCFFLFLYDVFLGLGLIFGDIITLLNSTPVSIVLLFFESYYKQIIIDLHLFHFPTVSHSYEVTVGAQWTTVKEWWDRSQKNDSFNSRLSQRLIGHYILQNSQLCIP